MPHATPIPADVRDVLSSAVISGHEVRLTGKLARPLYVRTDTVLRALGGTWVRRAGAHLFRSDPSVILATALRDGAYADPQKLKQAYFTPAPVGIRLVMLIDILPHHRVLEPEAGNGALVSVILGHGPAELVAIELD